jgi:hypothetical protein
MRGARLSAASIIVAFVALAMVLWGVAAATTWANFDSGRGLTVEACGAGTATLLAWYTWRDRRRELLDQRRERLDRERELLIRTLAGVVVPAQPQRPTRPLPIRRAI